MDVSKRKLLLVGLPDSFRDLGCLIIDADPLTREVVEPGEPADEKLAEVGGKGVILGLGTWSDIVDA